MNLLDLLKEDEFEHKWAASTNDDEYKGPCPFCGGEDRFCVWPKQGNRGRYWCRQCEQYGDAIDYLRSFKEMTYIEACKYLGIQARPTISNIRHVVMPQWLPKPPKLPDAAWQGKARELIKIFEKRLNFTSSCKQERQWLRNRGLKDSTVKKAHLGWVDTDSWCRRQRWGLPEKIEEGKRKKLWVPTGLLIPHIHDGHVIRLRVRRPDPEDEYGRYILVSGGDTRPMHWRGQNEIFVIVESELDGCLLNQVLDNSIGVIALGSVRIRPDVVTHRLLSEADLILVALDNDEGGTVQSWKWWLRQYSQAKWWPIPLEYGKDPSEAFKSGLDLEAWVEAGMVDSAKRIKGDSPKNDSGSNVTIEDLLGEDDTGDRSEEREFSIEDLLKTKDLDTE